MSRTCRRPIVENCRHRLVCTGLPKSDGFSVSGGAGGGLACCRNRRFAASGSAPTLVKMSAQFVVPMARPIPLGGPQNAVFPPGANSST